MTKVAIVQHVAHEGPGLLGDLLAERRVEMRFVHTYLGEEFPPPSALDGAIVLGGPMGVYDNAEHRWLEAERSWLVDLVREQKHVLGVCLGAQQLAAALGAQVETGPEPEIGAGRVVLTEAGRSDPLFGPEGDALEVVHWHGDTFALPEKAVHLAQSDRYVNQAFRFMDNAYGLQFHIEVDDRLAKTWQPFLPEFVELTGEHIDKVEACGRRVLTRFCDRLARL